METSPLPQDLYQEFLGLASALSPENLTCDGELSASLAAAKAAQLRAKWRRLEANVGRKVTEDEVWTRMICDQEEKRQGSPKEATASLSARPAHACREPAGFSPTPWKIAGHGQQPGQLPIVDADGKEVARVTGGGFRDSCALAAAPELLWLVERMSGILRPNVKWTKEETRRSTEAWLEEAGQVLRAINPATTRGVGSVRQEEDGEECQGMTP
jgi:hypothetical protein